MQHVQTHCNYDKHRQVTMLKFDRLFYITETLLTPKKKTGFYFGHHGAAQHGTKVL